ncbi:hypothetical protein [Paractinoplanes abujensis]|uniref:Secreted protein n=1 Tax=Paractinoplanes abujensis TaxID=882441 RepID=A0A7W7CV39_9ACTN|nr:hypothetical protein [Actinoplanes abujensis]MBB4695235.1 hypothetical protein [Actinoplanes abujensis]
MAAFVAAVVASFAVAAPASAANPFEFNRTEAKGLIICLIYSDAGCGEFDPDGDVFHVWDQAADGHSAAVYWHNYLPGSTALYRWGSCVNSNGNGDSGQCNKNFVEGSRIDYKVCAYDSGTTPSDVNNYFQCSAVKRTYA